MVLLVSGRLEPQHRLGDDRALYLIAAAEDRPGAAVEISGRRDLRGLAFDRLRASVAIERTARGELQSQIRMGASVVGLRARWDPMYPSRTLAAVQRRRWRPGSPGTGTRSYSSSASNSST